MNNKNLRRSILFFFIKKNKALKQSHSISFIVLFVCSFIHVHSAESLEKVYALALSYNKASQIDSSVLIMDTYFDTVENIEKIPQSTHANRYALILNDYAFFNWNYYITQTKKFCTLNNYSSVSDFMIFKSSINAKIEDLLNYVIKIDSNRTVAYLNLADVLYENDSDDNAETMYVKYVTKMKQSNNEKKIPPRAKYRDAHKKYYQCK